MKKALAIIAYARSDYFETVFPSILNQIVEGKSVSEVYDIYVFQDGLWNDETEKNRHGHREIRDFIKNLRPKIKVFIQHENLGVALHFDFVERLLFVEKEYDFVVFHEDDLILAPGYMAVIDMMAEKFQDDPRVGMISAHPGNPMVPLEQQRANRDRFAPMGHNWGFGVTRRFWEKRQPLVDCYLDLVRNVPYRKRDEKIIFEWLRRVGFNQNASSQDYIKTCATYALGAVKLSTFPNLALPIGRNGLHSNRDIFKKIGFDRTVVFNEKINNVADLTDEQYVSIYQQGASEVGKVGAQVSVDGTNPDVEEWQQRLNNGEFHPRRIMPDIVSKGSDMQEVKWHTADIPVVPHMEEDGLALFMERIEKAKVYLEYGAGGSTVFAASKGCAEIHSVESDQGFLDAVRNRVAELGGPTELKTYYANIGPTKEWGQPTDLACARFWPRYSVAPWENLIASDRRPDVILIDGRFRSACFLVSAMLAKPGTSILFDDYCDRSHYHVVEKYIKPRLKAGRMAEFWIESPLRIDDIVTDLIFTISDPA